MTKGFTLVAALAAALAVTAACTHKDEAPALTGPSGFSTSVANTPVASFQILPNPVDLSSTDRVTFDASSSCGQALSASGGCDAGVASFQFSFSDGTTAPGPVVVRSISDDAIGTISATLVVTNQNGAAASTTRSAQVLRSPPPKASATFVPSPAVLSSAGKVTVVFTDTSTATPPRVIKTWEWDFLDGRTVTGSSVQHVFTEEGTFPVVLTVTDDLGQQAKTTLQVVVTLPKTP